MDSQTDSRGQQPLSSTERAIADLWREALQTPQLPHPSDDFFELGGDSTTMVMVELSVQEELGVEIPAGSLLSTPTLEKFSALVDSKLQAPLSQAPET